VDCLLPLRKKDETKKYAMRGSYITLLRMEKMRNENKF